MKITRADWYRVAWPLGMGYGYTLARLVDGRWGIAAIDAGLTALYCAVAIYADRKRVKPPAQPDPAKGE